MNTQLCKAKSIRNGQWVYGYYVKGLDMYDKEIHLILNLRQYFILMVKPMVLKK